MSKYRKYYCPRRRELFVEIDRTQPGTAGGNCSDEDWDRIFSTKDGKTTRYAHREIFDRDIFEQTLQCRDTDAVHGEVRTIERFETQWIAYVLTADRGRVALPATVVAHDCPEYGPRFVTEGGTCPSCGYKAPSASLEECDRCGEPGDNCGSAR